MSAKETWPLTTLNFRKEWINTNPDYQRPAVWKKSQKQLLMDTIVREYDIPKIYLHKVDKKKYDVIDGQQRIRTIWDFYDNKFAFSNDADPVDGFEVKGKYYDELDKEIVDKIDSYALDLVILEDKSDDEITEMFLRLQNGTSLKAQEKRNAMTGKMRDFVKKLATHQFFTESVYFQNARFAHEHVAAQMCLLALTGGLCDIKDKNLNDMYKNQRDFDENSQDAKHIRKILNIMYKMFDKKIPELKRYNVVSLFALLCDIQPNYVIKGREKDIANWFLDFERRRMEDQQKPEEEQDSLFANYLVHTKQSTDAIHSLSFRHKVLKEDLLNFIPNLLPKDEKRMFDEAQRQVIFRRDKGVCQLCGAECKWDSFEADHITPWSQGGKTTVENGQVLCPKCNSSKGDRV